MKSPMEQKIPGIFQISVKKDNLQRLSKIFETNFSKISVPFDSEFPESLVECIAPKVIWPPKGDPGAGVWRVSPSSELI